MNYKGSNLNEVMARVQNFLEGLPYEEFEKTILRKWIKRMKDSIIAEGRHFEKEQVIESDIDSG